MRIRKTLKNSIYSVGSYLLLAILALAIRKVFLKTLSEELLGYEGLFGNVFALLAMADLGLETVILYRLFPAFAKEEKAEINRIMSVYRYLYRIVGFTVIVLGLLLSPFLRYIIKDNNYQWEYVYAIYFFQLGMTLSSYFLAYKRLMFTVSQQEYECVKIDTIVSIAFSIIRLVTLLLLRNYFVYLFCNFGSNVVSNLLISKKVDRSFDYFKAHAKITISDVKALRIGKDLKNNLFQKICGTIYGGTDNIVISALLGITQVGLLSNYLIISGYVTTFLTKMLRPFQMSIGNYVYSTDREKGYGIFRMFDFISYLIAAVVSCCYYCLFNPIIELLFGTKYLLAQSFVLVFCINQYIMWNHQFLTYYRYSFGKYELDRFPVFVAALLNVVLSIILSRPLGMTGIMLGTVIGHLGFWFGRMRVVYTEYIDEGVNKYLFRQGIRLALCGGEILVTAYVCKSLPITIVGIVIRLLLSMSIPCILNLLLFCRTSEFTSLLEYSKEVSKQILRIGTKQEKV